MDNRTVVALAIVVIVIIVVLYAIARSYLSHKTAQNRSWVGTGAPVGAFVLRSDRLQSPATNPYYSAFSTLAAGTALAPAFPPLVGSAFSAKPQPLRTPSGAPLWIADSQGLADFVNSYYVGRPRPTPAAAQAELRQLVADSSNAAQMFSLVLSALSSGSLSLGAAF